MIALRVFLDRSLVGRLSHDPQSNRFAFDYEPGWVQDTKSFGLSPRLPLEVSPGQSVEQHSTEVKQFFENLLPEGQGLDAAAILHQVSKANLVGLLIHLGRDMAGALRVEIESDNQGNTEPFLTPQVSSSSEFMDSQLRPLSNDELSTRIRDRAYQSFAVWDGKVRMSIAGFQDKIVAFEFDGARSFVDGGPCSSNVIIKPESVNAHMAGMTGNEFMCMRLSLAAKLKTATVRLEHVPEPILVIDRFDRETANDGMKVRRMHVIDGCQALGLSSAFKYERPYGAGVDVRHIRDGASLPKLFNLMQYSYAPAAQKQEFLRWVIFQALIGNTDAHAKNVSFFCGTDGLRLAPAYDLLCADAFGLANLDDKYAMAIGDAFNAKQLTAFEWAEFANLCGLSQKLVGNELAKLAKLVLGLLPGNAEIARLNLVSDRTISAVSTSIESMCKKQLAIAKDIARVDPKMLSESPLQ